MTAADFIALLPLEIVAGTAVAVMVAAAVRRHHGLAVTLTLAGVAASFASLAVAWPLAPQPVMGLLVIDRPALFFAGLVLAAAFVTVLLSYGYLMRLEQTVPSSGGVPEGRGGLPAPHRPSHYEHLEEYYILLLLATVGALVLVASVHFVTFFLGLELMSVPFFALAAYPRANPLSLEAGLKYLILAGASSAFVLFGLALAYAALGTLDFASLAAVVRAGGGTAGGLLVTAGAGLLIVGIGFKLSLVPFHGWAPDVYQGAPAPVTAFVATVSKGAVFALLLRVFGPLVGPSGSHDAIPGVLAAMALASMFAGNALALLQKNVKRLLAYSSIAHMGYLLVALLAGGRWAATAVALYLVAYVVTTLGAFGVVAALSSGGRDADAGERYRGLAWRRPWLAFVLTLCLLSLAGIPLTAGFVGKFTVLAAGVSSGLWWLVGALVINSALGLFYYLRLIVTLYQPSIAQAGAPPPVRTTSCALAALVLALVWLGAYPAPLLTFIQKAFGL